MAGKSECLPLEIHICFKKLLVDEVCEKTFIFILQSLGGVAIFNKMIFVNVLLSRCSVSTKGIILQEKKK